CATVGPQLTNNKAHSATTYDRMIMVGPLEPSARARVPDHLWLFVLAPPLLAPQSGPKGAVGANENTTAHRHVLKSLRRRSYDMLMDSKKHRSLSGEPARSARRLVAGLRTECNSIS